MVAVHGPWAVRLGSGCEYCAHGVGLTTESQETLRMPLALVDTPKARKVWLAEGRLAAESQS
jgi:hypothetical protein